MKGKFKVGVRLLPLKDGARAVHLYLKSFAKITAVSEGGKPLPYLRDHLGARRSTLDDRLYDVSLVVLLDSPLAKGVERRLDLEYELDILNYAPGRDWYPDGEGDETFLLDSHTARLEVTSRKKFEVRANGRLDEAAGKTDGKTVTTVWIADHPIKMLTFTYADYLHEERVTREGVPDVICFGSKAPLASGFRFRDVGADVSGSLAFYQQLFDQKLPPTPIYVSSINAGHGQAFDGFIQLAHRSFDLLGPGIGELFRAHEAAHQFWGVMVGAASYRDAWLGEAFAEYSGMMYVEATMKDGPALLDEIIHAYNDEQERLDQVGVQQIHPHGGQPGQPCRATTPADRPRLPGGHRRGADRLRLAGLRQGGAGPPHAAWDAARRRTGPTRSSATCCAIPAHLPRPGGVDRRLRGRPRRHAPGDWTWFFDEWVEGMGSQLPLELHGGGGAGAAGKYVATSRSARATSRRLPDVRPRHRISGRPQRAPPGDGRRAGGELSARARCKAEKSHLQSRLRGTIQDETGLGRA